MLFLAECRATSMMDPRTLFYMLLVLLKRSLCISSVQVINPSSRPPSLKPHLVTVSPSTRLAASSHGSPPYRSHHFPSPTNAEIFGRFFFSSTISNWTFKACLRGAVTFNRSMIFHAVSNDRGLKRATLPPHQEKGSDLHRHTEHT